MVFMQIYTFFADYIGQHLNEMNSIDWSTYEITGETMALLHRTGYTSRNALKSLTDKDLTYLRDKKSMIPGQVSLLRTLRDNLKQESRENQNNSITLPNELRPLQETQLHSHPEDSAQPQHSFAASTNMTNLTGELDALVSDDQVSTFLESLEDNSVDFLNSGSIVASIVYGSQDNGSSDMEIGVTANDEHAETTQSDDVSLKDIGRCSSDFNQDHQLDTGTYDN